MGLTVASSRASAHVAVYRPQMACVPRAFSSSIRVRSDGPQRLGRCQSSAPQDSGRPTILVAEKLGDAGIKMLEEFGNVDQSLDMSPADLCAKIPLCDALVIRSATKVTEEVFQAAKGRLKVVGRAGVGIDNVDLAAATASGVMVVNAPNANTVAAAEHGIALLCALARNVSQADASMKAGKWERGKYVGVSLVGKTIAVMGFGKVGADVARRAKGLGMNVIAHDPYAPEERARAINVRLVTFQEAIETADFLSLHMPLTPGTKNIFNKDIFAKCKKGVRIINVARGGVIDEADLLDALNSGQVAQAALDVFSSEPPEGNPLVDHPNCVCTPHLGASTKEAQVRILGNLYVPSMRITGNRPVQEGVAIEVAEAVLQSLKGELSSNTVNAPMVPAETLAELQPYITLAQGLGKTAVQLVSEHGFADIEITYHSCRGTDLDTRLLRANVIKGVLEEITTANVNMVNADLLSDQRGLRIKETITRSDASSLISDMSVKISTPEAKFSGAVAEGGILVACEGVNALFGPTQGFIGFGGKNVAIDGQVVMVRQRDQPGLIAAVAQVLAEDKVNVSYMTVSRVTKGATAIMCIGVDDEPSAEALARLPQIEGIIECGLFNDL